LARFGFLSTYPPTRCGLATFTEALAAAMGEYGPRVVRVMDEASPLDRARFGVSIVAAELVGGDSASARASIRALNDFDVVIVQHEYGIYGGVDGDEVVAVLDGLSSPSIIVLHTVLDTPTPGQKRVLERVSELATAIVVMSDAARGILETGYDVVMSKVSVIPHGVATSPARSSGKAVRPVPGRVLTWGLIGPGKGLEWGIRAMAQLTDLPSHPQYLIVGRTHPKVLLHEGEAYRRRLEKLVEDLGLQEHVRFVDEYLDSEQLAEWVATAEVVLLPYDTENQVTSGVLVEAIAAGKPVVSTAFPHSIELLSDGAGVIVAHADPQSIADGLRRVLGGARDAAQMSAAATKLAAGTGWPEVAARYRALGADILSMQAA